MEPEKKTLKAGDTVKLKCGLGPIMMVELSELHGMHTCIWFDKNNCLQKYAFPADFLVPFAVDERC